MSAQTEPTGDESEAEVHAANQSTEQSKSEASMLNNQTGPPLLEDEEMPTYISVSTPSRREESDVSNVKQQDTLPMEEDHSRSPYPSDDQGGGSVYVLSSEEDSNYPPYSDEDDDEYRYSEDEMELENEHENPMMNEEEEDEEEDDDDEEARLRMQHDEEGEFDEDFNAECNDRASDDIILSNRLRKQHKERSLSLQDLSICKNNTRALCSKKRYSINALRQNHSRMEQNFVMNPIAHKRPGVTMKYQHVESKVKQYIKDIKEQNRKSMERRAKEEYTINRNHVENKSGEAEQLPSVASNKTIKDYAEKAIKDLQHEESGDNDDTGIYVTSKILENGREAKLASKVLEGEQNNIVKHDDVDIYCDFIPNERNLSNFDEKRDKQNGSIEPRNHQTQFQNSLDKNIKLSGENDTCMMNGHQQSPLSENFSVRTLSYEEYMHGVSNNGPKQDGCKQTFNDEHCNRTVGSDKEVAMAKTDLTDTNVVIRIDNVKSIPMEMDNPKEDGEVLNFAKRNTANKIIPENPETISLRTRLNQKTAQLDTLLDAYQKTLAENLKMKQELDMLRSALAKQEKENKPPEKKIASVQTDNITEPVIKQEVVTEAKETNNKISSSSVASTLSSMEQWTDSICSPAISLKPPDVTTILNSDDSTVLTDHTPRKTARPLSRAFITSSRILQTLSNITQGKVNSDSLLQSSKKEKRTTEYAGGTDLSSDKSYIQASSSKKRKATDMLGLSTFVQPFKVPHTSTEPFRRRTSFNVDVESRTPDKKVNPNIEQENELVGGASNLEFAESVTEDAEDQDDNVKCFVYREDENTADNSFLIQAEEPAKDDSITEKGRIRECGPYLLGNVEVRMTEVNGTISIWGKEVSQTSTVEKGDEEIDTSTKEIDKKTCECCQRTPQLKLNRNPFACSTDKKSNISERLTDYNTTQCSSHPASFTAGGLSFQDHTGGKRHTNTCSPNAFIPSCENCSFVTHSKRHSYKHCSNLQDKIHSCCLHNMNSSGQECCTAHRERSKYGEAHICSNEKLDVKCSRKGSCRNTPNTSKHSCENFANPSSGDAEINCRHNMCPLYNTVDNCQEHSKYCNSHQNIPYTCKLSSANTSDNDNGNRHSYNLSTSHDGDEDLLISSRRSHETPEVRQRRLRGKKVRGILMDLFRGCGDCRNKSLNNGGKSTAQQKGSPCLTNTIPHIKVSPCSPEASCSNGVTPAGKCCRSYAHRIESQLEEFRMEMERVRSRSDAILDMLSVLHSVDMN